MHLGFQLPDCVTLTISPPHHNYLYGHLAGGLISLLKMAYVPTIQVASSDISNSYCYTAT